MIEGSDGCPHAAAISALTERLLLTESEVDAGARGLEESEGRRRGEAAAGRPLGRWVSDPRVRRFFMKQ